MREDSTGGVKSESTPAPVAGAELRAGEQETSLIGLALKCSLRSIGPPLLVSGDNVGLVRITLKKASYSIAGPQEESREIEYHCQSVDSKLCLTVLLADVMNGANVRVIQRRCGLGFALKPG
jgi:hypothetical protein